MRLSKEQSKRHNQAIELLQKESLSIEERDFVYNNYHEGATNINGLYGAFFTPMELAHEFMIYIDGGSFIDLCAGIGMLSYTKWKADNIGYYKKDKPSQFTCVEFCNEYYEIGKKLFPEANWILADVLDVKSYITENRYDWAISNPPFGNIKSGNKHSGKYKGADFEYKVAEIAMNVARSAAFIMPQMSCPFKISGTPHYETQQSSKYDKFSKQTGLTIENLISVDTSFAIDSWKGVKPMVEFVEITSEDFEEYSSLGTNNVEQLTLAI